MLGLEVVQLAAMARIEIQHEHAGRDDNAEIGLGRAR